MKVLCATDYSEVSVNAIAWVYDMLEVQGGGQLEIMHCVDPIRRSDMFIALDDMMVENAINDMKELAKKFIIPDDGVCVNTSVHKATSRTFIPKYASKHNFDLIVTGTTGLSNLKDMVVGSVTDYISRHSRIPVLTIPPNVSFSGIDTVVVGLGKEEYNNANNLSHIYNILKPHDPKIVLSQVLEKNHHTISVDLRIEEALRDLNYEYTTLERTGTVNNTINTQCKEIKADLLCMVQYSRTWLQNLIHRSITKQELFTIETPLLIIPD